MKTISTKQALPFAVVTVIAVAIGIVSSGSAERSVPSPVPVPQIEQSVQFSTVNPNDLIRENHPDYTIDLSKSIGRIIPVWHAASDGTSKLLDIYPPPGIYQDDKKQIVSLQLKNGKYLATVKVLAQLPTYEAQSDSIEYAKTFFPYKVPAIDFAREFANINKFLEGTQLRARSVTSADLAFPCIGNCAITPSNDIAWTFEFLFLTKEAAEEFKAEVESGTLIGQLTYRYPMRLELADGIAKIIFSDEFLKEANHRTGSSTNEFLTLEDVNKLQTQLVLSVRREVIGNATFDGLNININEIVAILFSRMEKQIDSLQDKRMQEVLYSLLMPAFMNSLKGETEYQDVVEETQTITEKATQAGENGAISLAVPIQYVQLGVSVEAGKKKAFAERAIDIAAKRHGINIRYEEATSRLVPIAFSLFQGKNNSENTRIEFSNIVKNAFNIISTETLRLDGKIHRASSLQKIFDARLAAARLTAEKQRDEYIAQVKEAERLAAIQRAEQTAYDVDKTRIVDAISNRSYTRPYIQEGGRSFHRWEIRGVIKTGQAIIVVDTKDALVVKVSLEGITNWRHHDDFFVGTHDEDHVHPLSNAFATITYSRSKGQTAYSGVTFENTNEGRERTLVEDGFRAIIPSGTKVAHHALLFGLKFRKNNNICVKKLSI